MKGTVIQINVSRGGVPKLAIEVGDVGLRGLAGDEHRYRYHGGPSKALLVMASELIDKLVDEGWPVFYGALGENLTTAGLDYRLWRGGMRLNLGEVLLELTTPRRPCVTLDPYGVGIQKRIFDRKVKAGDPTSSHWGESGFYASVIKPGRIAPGMPITLAP